MILYQRVNRNWQCGSRCFVDATNLQQNLQHKFTSLQRMLWLYTQWTFSRISSNYFSIEFHFFLTHLVLCDKLWMFSVFGRANICHENVSRSLLVAAINIFTSFTKCAIAFLVQSLSCIIYFTRLNIFSLLQNSVQFYIFAATNWTAEVENIQVLFMQHYHWLSHRGQQMNDFCFVLVECLAMKMNGFDLLPSHTKIFFVNIFLPLHNLWIIMLLFNKVLLI